MWVLLLIVFGLQEIGGPVIVTPLPKSQDEPFYQTLAECEKEKDRIMNDMIASYPGEHDFKMECKKVPDKVI